MQALDELAAQAQELDMGYKSSMGSNFTANYDASLGRRSLASITLIVGWWALANASGKL